MTTLPEAAIAPEEMLPPTRNLWQRARALAGERLSYALADQVTYSFGNMVVAALISRHCASREFGIYILTQRAMDVLIQVSNVFLWAPFTFNLPSTEAPRQKTYLGSLVAQQLLACVLAALVLFGAGRWAAVTPSRGLYYGVFAPLALTSIGILFREFNRRMYFAEMRFKAAFWTDLATVALQIGGVEWLLQRGRLTVPGTLWMLALGGIAVSLYWLATEWSTFSIQLRAIVADLKLNFHLGRWLLGGNMVFLVSSQCNPWMLGALLGGASVGAYAVCESVVNIPRVALTSLQNAMAPMMARALADKGKPALARVVARFNRLLFLGAAVFAVGIIAFGPWAARTIFAKHAVPSNARIILILLALNFIAFAATLAESYGLTAIDRAGLTFYANLAGLVAQVAVTFWLVRVFHVPGAAAAMLVGSVVVVAVRQLFYSREMSRP